ncbi:MBOAT family protein [Janthinobacterium sp. 17J80-10]|uniref:MBOAT family O-acyltransferase n=1 Tax=Janthinobacterium sp. 17J80-10 TaxID=2497863 RepID=UPI0010055ABF|nr:MBOAT family protein [Janthinobacterium sp. 17J80-10]QAU33434.1 MBOAT family protein [Janthinobacterium sp. 17J80-10]
MLFYELKFIIPFAFILLLYTQLQRKAQNYLILFAGYLFYGMWDWRFLSLLLITTALDYSAGYLIDLCKPGSNKRKLYLALSMAVNLGMLSYYKYMNFFAESLAHLLNVPIPANSFVANVILPAGISFYTFQSMSYVIDVYRGHIRAERNFVDFAAFVSYFPHLVAGPIQRADVLLAQITRDRELTLPGFFLGCRLFMFGLFKKLVVGDNVAKLVDPVFSNPQSFDSITLLVAAYAFSIQIYCDFSGYTDMARGVSKMMGINLTLNFNYPYFATSIRDFWTRWHISLSTWFRDYLYIPLGGNREGETRAIFNLFVTFLLSGLWHGAGWTYILWGAYHGTLVAIEHYCAKRRLGRWAQNMPVLLKMVITFHLVVFGWILFRVTSLAQFGMYLNGLFTWKTDWLQMLMQSKTWFDVFGVIASLAMGAITIKFLIYYLPLLGLDLLEWRAKGEVWEKSRGRVIQGVVYGILLFLIFMFGVSNAKQFIYFQF